MRNVIIVMAHRESTPIFMRHLPLWRAHNIPIIAFCPSNSFVEIPIGERIPVISYGGAEHHGTESIRRFKFMLSFIGQLNYNEFWVFESDSFCLNPTGLKMFAGVHLYGGRFFIGEDDPAFLGSSYIHPPFCIIREGLERIQLLGLTEEAEHGFWDRWFGLACELAKLNMVSYLDDGQGFSRNTIEPEYRHAAVEAVKAGAVFFHGCKDAMTLHLIQDAYEKTKAVV